MLVVVLASFHRIHSEPSCAALDKRHSDCTRWHSVVVPSFAVIGITVAGQFAFERLVVLEVSAVAVRNLLEETAVDIAVVVDSGIVADSAEEDLDEHSSEYW